jgi:secondary thiamine-phosphate synthase enzyme
MNAAGLRRASLTLETEARDQVVLLKERIEQALAGLAASDGLLHVFVPHTSAAVTVNEGWDPDVLHDFLGALDRLVPWKANYRHTEGNSAAHIKAVLVGPSVTIAVAGGKLALGRWQDVYVCEFDGPRRRTVELSYLPG